jgi:small subunit ribosomal protein S2
VLSREKGKLEKILGGITTMNKLPGAIFLIDVKKEHIAVDEARKLNIPIYAIVDTNCDPDLIDYPVPANDDAVKSIELITRVIADSINEARNRSEMKKMHPEEEIEAGKVSQPAVIAPEIVPEKAPEKPAPDAEGAGIS